MSSRGRLGRIAGRAGQSVLTLATVLVLVFLLVRLIPGDPVTAILGSETSEAAEAALREELGLDRSLAEQFTSYVAGVLRGDLGHSAVQRGDSVAHIIVGSMPTTLAVIATGMALSLVLGISAGLAAALSPLRGVDVAVRTVVMILYATPTFLVGLLLDPGLRDPAGLAARRGAGRGYSRTTCCT